MAPSAAEAEVLDAGNAVSVEGGILGPCKAEAVGGDTGVKVIQSSRLHRLTV